jgi:hypothetical protein
MSFFLDHPCLSLADTTSDLEVVREAHRATTLTAPQVPMQDGVHLRTIQSQLQPPRGSAGFIGLRDGVKLIPIALTSTSRTSPYFNHP